MSQGGLGRRHRPLQPGPLRVGTIASDLALRFGGLSTDFLVAAFHERDYVIMLPQWVRPDSLINNELIHLSHCRLWCVPWDPLHNATPSNLTYKAWIKLLNLPFECWSAHKVSAVACGFGRFIEADDSSSNVVDMMWYRCLIAVNDLANIPEHLAITLGDVTVTVPIQIDSTVPFGGDDRGIPFANGDASEGGDQTDPRGPSLIPSSVSAARSGTRTGEAARSYCSARTAMLFRRAGPGGRGTATTAELPAAGRGQSLVRVAAHHLPRGLGSPATEGSSELAAVGPG